MYRAVSPLLALVACDPGEPGPSFVPDTDVQWTAPPPVARCSADPPEVEPGGDVTLDASESFDPSGSGLDSYRWELVEVPEHGADDLDGSDVTTTFAPDLAGAWAASVVVTNGNSVQSLPCTVPIAVVPAQRLWIELTWDNAGDNLDLHLMKAGADYGSDDDCSQENCTPVGTAPRLVWGSSSNTADDPILKEDNTNQGPEIALIDEPASGSYSIAVEDVPNSDSGDTTAVVRVFADGALAWEQVRTFRDEPPAAGMLTYFAKVSFPSGVVTSCPASGCD